MDQDYVVDVPCTVLEFKKDSFVGKDGGTVEYQTALVRVGGRVLKFAVDKLVDLSKETDNQVTLAVELIAGDNLKVKAKIVGLR